MEVFIKNIFRPIDNSSLVIFRILFGLFLSIEILLLLFGGAVYNIFIHPHFTFTYIGFEWLQPLDGWWMYGYFTVLLILASTIMIGWHYRFACFFFFVMILLSFLMQKTYYNNHYYLYILLIMAMFFMPANRYLSLDVKRKNVTASVHCPNWCKLFFIVQVAIVFFFAGIAKIQPDWINGLPIKVWFNDKAGYHFIGDFLQNQWFQSLVVYGGIVFDLFIVPLLLYKKTRKFAFVISIFFHLSNAYIFGIGMLPFTMIALTLFFYPDDQIRRIFFSKKPSKTISNLYEKGLPTKSILLVSCLFLYFSVQIALPLRHWCIPGDVTWTEEGNRFAWRMMLRDKRGEIWFKITDKKTNKSIKKYPREMLTYSQSKAIVGNPDMIWQFTQFLKKKYNDRGRDVAIHVYSSVSLNGHEPRPIIDESINLADEPWNRFGNNKWILPFENDIQVQVN